MAQKAKSAQTAQKNERARYWAGIFYEESLPKNWQAILDGMQLQYALSPWHDRDVDDKGKIKKKHRHVIFYFCGKKCFSQVKAIFDELNQPVPQVCQNHVGAVRYFFHLDDADKAQYELAGYVDKGIGVLDLIKLSGDKEKVFMTHFDEVCELLEKFKYETFLDLMTFLRDNGKDDLRYWCAKNYGIVDRLCDTYRWKYVRSRKNDLADLVSVLRSKL